MKLVDCKRKIILTENKSLTGIPGLIGEASSQRGPEIREGSKPAAARRKRDLTALASALRAIDVQVTALLEKG